ncbi:hypothetical protein Tco_0488600 [Tanacetum coccineum]
MLCLLLPTASRYEVGESSTAVPRPTGGRRVDYGFVGTLDAEARRQRAEAICYGIRDTWEQDTQEIYAMIKDTQDRQTQIYQTVETLVDDSRTHVWTQDHRMDVQDSLIAALTAQVSSLQGHLATALGEIRALQAREQARADAPEDTASTVVGPNNMPPKRTARTARTARVAAATTTTAAAATPMTTAAIEQLVADRVSAPPLRTC